MSKIRFKSFSLFLLITYLFISCNNKETITAESIVKKTIEKHGGLKVWNSLKNLSFDKKVVLFLEDGSIENESLQHQEFTFKPELSGKLSWKKDSNNISIIYNKGQISKTVNDSLIIDSKELKQAKNSFFASQYVITKPFDLIGNNTKLEYSKIVTIENKKAYEIKVSHLGDSEKSDQWFYYVDVNTYQIIVNKVVLQDHTSLVNNLTFNNDTEFIFNEHRKSYRLNNLVEKTYLRAEYFYSNFKTSY